MLEAVSYHEGLRPTQPESPYRFEVEMARPDTLLIVLPYGWGMRLCQWFNLGRYWSQGLIQYLYVPSGFLKAHNEFPWS